MSQTKTERSEVEGALEALEYIVEHTISADSTVTVENLADREETIRSEITDLRERLEEVEEERDEAIEEEARAWRFWKLRSEKYTDLGRRYDALREAAREAREAMVKLRQLLKRDNGIRVQSNHLPGDVAIGTAFERIDDSIDRLSNALDSSHESDGAEGEEYEYGGDCTCPTGEPNVPTQVERTGTDPDCPVHADARCDCGDDEWCRVCLTPPCKDERTARDHSGQPAGDGSDASSHGAEGEEGDEVVPMNVCPYGSDRDAPGCFQEVNTSKWKVRDFCPVHGADASDADADEVGERRFDSLREAVRDTVEAFGAEVLAHGEDQDLPSLKRGAVQEILERMRLYHPTDPPDEGSSRSVRPGKVRKGGHQKRPDGPRPPTPEGQGTDTPPDEGEQPVHRRRVRNLVTQLKDEILIGEGMTKTAAKVYDEINRELGYLADDQAPGEDAAGEGSWPDFSDRGADFLLVIATGSAHSKEFRQEAVREIRRRLTDRPASVAEEGLRQHLAAFLRVDRRDLNYGQTVGKYGCANCGEVGGEMTAMEHLDDDHRVYGPFRTEPIAQKVTKLIDRPAPDGREGDGVLTRRERERGQIYQVDVQGNDWRITYHGGRFCLIRVEGKNTICFDDFALDAVAELRRLRDPDREENNE